MSATSPRSPTSSPPSAPATPVSEVSEEEELKSLKEEENVYNFDSEEQPTETEDRYSLFLEFLKQIRPGMEMYRLSVPTFILQPISLLEKLSIYSSPNDLLDGIEHQKIPELRFITVTKWILSNWRTIPRIGLEGVKPYNPILGEQFECEWNTEDGSKYMFIAEQVSHHPPISGFFMYNEKKQFYYYGSCYPQTHFSWNSFGTTMGGDFVVELPAFKERYVVKHPPVYANGIIWGKKVLEIGEELTITCEESGYKASIKFESGNNNQLEGSIYDKAGSPVYTIKGQVNKTVNLKSNQTKKESVFYDSGKIKRLPKTIKPVVDQKTNESRRNWHKVTVALRKGDHDAASLQKYLIEERERKIRKERQERSETWTPKLFTLVNDHWIYNNPPSNLKISKPVANATTSSSH